MVHDSKGTGVHNTEAKMNIALFLFNFTLQTDISCEHFLWLSFSIAVLHEDNRPKTSHN